MVIRDTSINAELETILRKLQEVLHDNGIKLISDIKDTGNNIMITCPYHKEGQERRPSAGIHKETGVFHCLACGETHSLCDMIAYCLYGVEEEEKGWKWLLDNFVSMEVENRDVLDLHFDRDTKHCVANANRDFIPKEVVDKYMTYHPYMRQRQIDIFAARLFKLGYDAESDCILFPVRDVQGRTLFFARRSVKGKFFNYPAGVEKPVYGLYECHFAMSDSKMPETVYICESMIDALTLWSWGKYAVALNGLGTEKQINQLKSLPVRKFIVATDNDDAGKSARKFIKSKITWAIVTELELPEGKKDINELTREEFLNCKEYF